MLATGVVHAVLGGVFMETIGGRYTFSQPKREISADKVCVRFGNRKRIPYIDTKSAMKYVLGASDSSLDIECIKRLRFSR